MSLRSAEPLPQLSSEEQQQFERIYAARASFQQEGNTLFDALDEEAKAKYIEWKKIQDNEELLKHRNEPVIVTPFRRSTQLPPEMLAKLANQSEAEPSKPKKAKKRCNIL